MSTALVLHGHSWSRCLSDRSTLCSDSQVCPKHEDAALPVLPSTLPWSRAFPPWLQPHGSVPRPPCSLNPLISQSHGPKPTSQCLGHLVWKVRRDGTWLALGWESSWEYWGWGVFPYPAGSPRSLPCGLALLSSYPSLNNTRTRENVQYCCISAVRFAEKR